MKGLVALIGVGLLLSCPEIGAQQVQSKSAKSSPAAKSTNSSKSNQGEKRFRVNCGRCHKARTAIRHMRVRAMLSAEDEQLILKFLAP
jgi:mono/diheme cytochrome c family protein